jgi:hypothetical protein
MPVNPRLLDILNHGATRTIGGGLAGAALGSEVAAPLMGYDDLEGPKAISMLVHGLTGATLLRRPELLKSKALPFWLAGEEALPMGFAALDRQQGASKEMAEAMRGITETVPQLDKPTLSEQLQGIMESPTARGAGTGAALAGLAALLTGATRAPTTAELGDNRSRPGMIMSDFGKYVLPASLGGGVIGSLRGSGGSPQG